MVTVTINLPPDLEKEYLAASRDVARDVKEASALALFRTHRISHVELAHWLELNRLETDAFLHWHGVTEGTLTKEKLNLQTQISPCELHQ